MKGCTGVDTNVGHVKYILVTDEKDETLSIYE